MQPWGYQILVCVEFLVGPSYVRYAHRSEPLGCVIGNAALSLACSRAPVRIPAFSALLDYGRKVRIPLGVPVGPLCDILYTASEARGRRPTFRVSEIPDSDGGLVDGADTASREIFTSLICSSDALMQRHTKEFKTGSVVDVSDAASLGDATILRPVQSPVVCMRVIILAPPHESRLDVGASTRLDCALVARVHSSAQRATDSFNASVEGALDSAFRSSYENLDRSKLTAIVHGVDLKKAGFGDVSLDDLRISGGCIHPDGWLYVALREEGGGGGGSATA